MTQPKQDTPLVRWDRGGLRTSACNLASVRGMADGIALAFGTSKPGAGGELEIALLHRVHLEHAAAQRLRDLLAKLASEYEARYRKPN